MPLPYVSPSTPETLALAGVWATLVDVTVMVLILFWAIDAFAPPQDLSWKPLRLADQPGLATGLKFDRIARDRSQCRAVLRDGGVAF